MNPLRRLDDLVIPGAARGVRRTADRLSGRNRSRSQHRGPLRRVDDRLANRGLLGFVREVPQVGYLASGAVIIAGTLGALSMRNTGAGGTGTGARTGSDGTRGGAATGCPLPRTSDGIAAVGPDSGTAVSGYLGSRRSLVDACAAADPTMPALAVVSFTTSLSPQRAAVLLAGTTTTQLYAVLPSATGTARLLPVATDTGQTTSAVTTVSLATSFMAAFTSAAVQFAADATSQESQAGSVTSSDPAQLAFRADFLTAAKADRAREQALREGCSCAYGALVQAPFAQLQRLAGTSGVRLVDPAPLGTAQEGLTARPVLPAERTAIGSSGPPTPIRAGQL